MRWLKPTVLKVKALARRRTCVNRTPIESSKLVSFWRTGDVSMSCRSVWGSWTWRGEGRWSCNPKTISCHGRVKKQLSASAHQFMLLFLSYGAGSGQNIFMQNMMSQWTWPLTFGYKILYIWVKLYQNYSMNCWVMAKYVFLRGPMTFDRYIPSGRCQIWRHFHTARFWDVALARMGRHEVTLILTSDHQNLMSPSGHLRQIWRYFLKAHGRGRTNQQPKRIAIVIANVEAYKILK